MEKKKIEGKKVALRVSRNSIIVNMVLSVFKLIAGIIGNSKAMVSDAIHSASDVLSTIIVIAGVKISSRKSDADHQYGHERMECVASIVLAVVLFFTGLEIGLKGVEIIIDKNYGDIKVPGIISLIAALASIIVKEGMYWYTKAAADKINSTALMADAWHHRSDAMSSIGSLVGILGARMGYSILDPLASVVISIFIIKAAIDIFKSAIGELVDKSCDEKVSTEMKRIILKQEGVLGLDEIKTRMFGPKIYVDIEISADGSQTLKEAHAIAERVHHVIENEFPKVKHCMVHVNPKEETENKA